MPERRRTTFNQFREAPSIQSTPVRRTERGGGVLEELGGKDANFLSNQTMVIQPALVYTQQQHLKEGSFHIRLRQRLPLSRMLRKLLYWKL